MKSEAERMTRIQPQFFAHLEKQIASLRSDGVDVIRLDIGSPDLPPAPHIVEALVQAAASPHSHGYQAHRATPELRQAWANYYQRLHGVQIDPDQEVVPLLGSKEGIFHLTMAMIDEGDVVLIPDPGYLTYRQAALIAGGEPYALPLLQEQDYLPDLDAIPEGIVRRAKLLWLNYPNNPTAATASLEFFSKAVEFARRYDLLICHDASYSLVTFDGYRAPSLLEVPGAKEAAIEFNTLSKSYNMAGWRVGAALGQSAALSALFKVKTHADSGHFLAIIRAAVAAMDGDQEWLQQRNAIYQKRRDLLIEGLNMAGLPTPVPKASLYLWIPIPKGWTSVEFARMVLENAHVSLTPGTVFGAQGEGYLRLSITAPEERLREAVSRLAAIRQEWDRVPKEEGYDRSIEISHRG